MQAKFLIKDNAVPLSSLGAQISNVLAYSEKSTNQADIKGGADLNVKVNGGTLRIDSSEGLLIAGGRDSILALIGKLPGTTKIVVGDVFYGAVNPQSISVDVQRVSKKMGKSKTIVQLRSSGANGCNTHHDSNFSRRVQFSNLVQAPSGDQAKGKVITAAELAALVKDMFDGEN